MSFDPENNEHKALLYKATSAAAKLAGEHFEDFLQRPFETPWSLSPTSRRNLQRGEYATIRAKILYAFIRDHHFAVGQIEASEIFPHTPAMRWREVLDEKASPNTLKIVPTASSFGLVKLDGQSDDADVQLKLGQRFCLDLNSDIGGYAIILQGLGDMWYPVQLADDGSYETAVTAGSNMLPRFPDGTPRALHEDTHEGLHSFVIVTATEPNIPFAIERLITWVNDHDARLHRVTAEIVR